MIEDLLPDAPVPERGGEKVSGTTLWIGDGHGRPAQDSASGDVDLDKDVSPGLPFALPHEDGRRSAVTAAVTPRHEFQSEVIHAGPAQVDFVEHLARAGIEDDQVGVGSPPGPEMESIGHQRRAGELGDQGAEAAVSRSSPVQDAADAPQGGVELDEPLLRDVTRPVEAEDPAVGANEEGGIHPLRVRHPAEHSAINGPDGDGTRKAHAVLRVPGVDDLIGGDGGGFPSAGGYRARQVLEPK